MFMGWERLIIRSGLWNHGIINSWDVYVSTLRAASRDVTSVMSLIAVEAASGLPRLGAVSGHSEGVVRVFRLS